ncbi:transporter substrate-binding domain-containing protein [Nocardioides lianchengensis]|uniref:Polar amino acid transport system substrate-binding protein n=1 Tax=Nocardioides lianchengensis TaxID=1045774 RepID=A0A1G6X467_9ACTN|nr:transporter substrate-binding domain-containing protein [Nocardioides lianchengensis]NYG09121.1 polar amino acid transport system substrate-binding protein [Nocardioides lianchengensis]SDD72086.1 polar amino acid transport system substrate-binding protein [Nocardioides lianchengensis]
MIAPTGVLRASINLGNPVLASGSAADPGGITVDLAREVGRRLDVPVELLCFDAARDSFAALVDGRADLGFLAIEPARAAEVSFTEAYAVIEAVFCVPASSSITSVADVDRPGVRVGVKQGSAYDLFLTRTLSQATLVRGSEGTSVFEEEGLEAGAGIRAPVTAYVEGRDGVRVVDEAFMQIRQALAVPRDRPEADVAWLAELVEELKASGFVAEALARSGQSGAAVVAPPSH